MMKVNDFVSTMKDIAENYETLYVYGCFGACLKESNLARYTTKSKYEYNQQPEVQANIKKAVEKGNVFGFDCVCLIKGVLWGWNGNPDATYGGAIYQANDVPDYNADKFFNMCSDISTDFSKVEVGEMLWTDGHCGVYIGHGLAVECTPIWDNKVQKTAVGNIGKQSGYNTRTWKKHGKIAYVDYSDNRFLYSGCEGADVKTLQTSLIELNYSCGSTGADGVFGRSTEIAVKNYQSDCGVEMTGYVTKEEFDTIVATAEAFSQPKIEEVPEIKVEEEPPTVSEPEVTPEIEQTPEVEITEPTTEIKTESKWRIIIQALITILETIKSFFK